MKPLDEEYLFRHHEDSLLLLYQEHGSNMFTMKDARKLGIRHAEFATMCADGGIIAPWCPKGAFQLSEATIKKFDDAS